MSTDIQFRPATKEDKAFVDALLFDTMHKFVEDTWQDDEARNEYYIRNSFRMEGTEIIQAGGEDIGRISRTRHPDHIFIDELHVLPKYHRIGAGRQALERVIAEARTAHLPIRATILKVNCPSQLLCFATGFRVFGFKEHRFQIEYQPDWNR
ncbi:MAG: N-acetyltransferase family protein [Acidobacteriota bacterium]